MKPITKTDKLFAKKILGYIEDIKDCLKHFDIKSHNDFKKARLSQFAVTQIITNIHEIKRKMTPETLSGLPEFIKIKLAGARNIASHDYEQVNFRIIYDICDILTSEKVANELNEVIDNGRDNNGQNNESCE